MASLDKMIPPGASIPLASDAIVDATAKHNYGPPTLIAEVVQNELFGNK